MSWRMYRVVFALFGVAIAVGLGLATTGQPWLGIPVVIASLTGAAGFALYRWVKYDEW